MFGRFVRWLGHKMAGAAHRIDEKKRDELRSTPFPDAYYPHVSEVAQTAGLTAEQRAKLHGDILIFLHEKQFVGVDLELADRHRVIVATTAAILVLGRHISQFDHVQEIRIYAGDPVPQVGGRYLGREGRIGGEVVSVSGVVELGWSSVTEGLIRPEGQHTAYHELAHAFDHADGRFDALRSHEHFERWSARLHNMPLHSMRIGDRIRTDLIGDAEGPELFAVASELFFECPRKLYKLEPTLFEALVEIYGSDPRAFTDR